MFSTWDCYNNVHCRRREMFIYQRCSLIEISLYQLMRADGDGLLEKKKTFKEILIENGRGWNTLFYLTEINSNERILRAYLNVYHSRFPRKKAVFFSNFWISLPGAFYYFNRFVYYKDAGHSRESFPVHKAAFSNKTYFRRKLIVNTDVLVPNLVFKRCLLTEHNKWRSSNFYELYIFALVYL